MSDHCQKMMCRRLDPDGRLDQEQRPEEQEQRSEEQEHAPSLELVVAKRNKEDGIEDDNENVARYFGETALSSFERGLSHGNDLKAGKEDSHILKHKILKHPNEDVTFSMKIVKRHPTCFQRLCHESVLIEMNENLNILNSKNSLTLMARILSVYNDD